MTNAGSNSAPGGWSYEQERARLTNNPNPVGVVLRYFVVRILDSASGKPLGAVAITHNEGRPPVIVTYVTNSKGRKDGGYFAGREVEDSEIQAVQGGKKSYARMETLGDGRYLMVAEHGGGRSTALVKIK